MHLDSPTRGVPLILAVGILLGLGYNALHKNPLPWKATAKAVVNLEDLEPTPAGTAPADDPKPVAADEIDYGVPESQFPIAISLAKAKTLYDLGVVILDAREHHEFAEGHIRGAVSAPYDDVGGDPDWLETMAADPKPLLVYCGGGDCELSLNLGFAVAQAGHRRVLVFEEGYEAWSKADYPTATGDQP